MDQLKTKNLSFQYFWRFVIIALTLRPRNTYMYVFRALFGFCNFYANSCWFWKLGAISFSYKVNCQEIEQSFWRLYVLVWCCEANQYSEITGIFVEISNRTARSEGYKK